MMPASHHALSSAEAKELVSHLPSIVNTRTAAETLGVSDRTLRRWIAEGRLRSLRTSHRNGGRLRIARAALVDLLVTMAG